MDDGGIYFGGWGMGVRPRVDVTGDRMFALATLLSRLESERLAELEEALTPRQLRLLRLIDQGVRSPTAIHDDAATTITLAAISQSLDLLVQRGFLARARDDEDGRRIILALTDTGRTAIEEAEKALGELSDTLLGDLSESDLGAVDSAIAGMRSRVVSLLVPR